jgi:16S rRNA G966 N2-methylase RsmD
MSAADDVVYDRALLLGPKRNEVLTLEAVMRYGSQSFGDPDYVSVYGLPPSDWYERGVQLLGRTAVECTRDRLGDLIGRDVASAGRGAVGAAPVIVDPFAGSANTLFWIRQHLPRSRAVGFESDAAVFNATKRNLSVLGIDLELQQVDYEAGLRALAVPDEEPLIVFIAPPWGDALSERSGLDLRRTSPPVSTIVDLVVEVFPRHHLLLAVQVYERFDYGSISELGAAFDPNAVSVYDIDHPGRNHGLALLTVGWKP